MGTKMVFKLDSPAFLENPSEQLAQMRAVGPLVRVKIPLLGQIWVTTTDEAARKVLKSHDIFRRDPEPITGKSLARRFWWMPASVKRLTHTMIAQDDPDHRHQRRLVEQAFARSRVENLRPAIEALAERLLDDMPQQGDVDIVQHYSRTLPFLTICTLLGIPETAHARLAARVAPLSAVTNPIGAALAMFRLRGVLNEFRDLFAAARNAAPGPGLISGLVHAEDDGVRLNDDELLSITLLLFLAGHETTVHLINAIIVGMAEDKSMKTHFIDAPETRPLMIEECLRFYSSVMLTKPMFAACDTDVLGAQVKKGDMVAALLIAANHDPARVDQPSEFRPERRPNAHIGFGFGPHVCLGMQLARLEITIALEALLRRYPDFALAAPTGWLKRPGLRVPARLQLHLTPPS